MVNGNYPRQTPRIMVTADMVEHLLHCLQHAGHSRYHIAEGYQRWLTAQHSFHATLVKEQESS